MRTVIGVLSLSLAACGPAAQEVAPPGPLPAEATSALARSLTAAGGHATHVWRDTPPLNDDGSVNAFIEISRGDRRKWEFDMATHERRIDRVIAEDVGPFPVNYGFVPQTVSYDGDPFDALVLGPPLDGGVIVRGTIVGVMFMEDEKGHDTKVVLSLAGPGGRARHELTANDRQRIGDFFNRYKDGDASRFSKVSGWGSVAQGLAYVTTTSAFFRDCRERAGTSCGASR